METWKVFCWSIYHWIPNEHAHLIKTVTNQPSSGDLMRTMDSNSVLRTVCLVPNWLPTDPAWSCWLSRDWKSVPLSGTYRGMYCCIRNASAHPKCHCQSRWHFSLNECIYLRHACAANTVKLLQRMKWNMGTWYWERWNNKPVNCLCFSSIKHIDTRTLCFYALIKI